MLPSTSQPGSADSTGSRSASTAAVEGLSRIILSLSDGWRVVVVVGMVAVAGAIAYLKLVPRVDATDPLRAPDYVTGGIPDPKHAGADTQNPQNVEAAHSAEEAQAALQWHFEHKSDDDPPEVAIADSHIFYRYYSRSDHCLYIRRHNGDSELTQWVSDPNYHQHSTHAPGRVATLRADSDVPAITRSVGLALAGLVPTLLAAPATETTPPLAMVGQRGSCMNPHPGTFRYWWGQPMDRCNSPMYREFADGCVHYQIYNRCANAWNSQINWTACVQQHRW